MLSDEYKLKNPSRKRKASINKLAEQNESVVPDDVIIAVSLLL